MVIFICDTASIIINDDNDDDDDDDDDDDRKVKPRGHVAYTKLNLLELIPAKLRKLLCSCVRHFTLIVQASLHSGV